MISWLLRGILFLVPLSIIEEHYRECQYIIG
jgi:hypothetical protein